MTLTPTPQSGPSQYRRRSRPFALAYWRLLAKTILFGTLAYFYREIVTWIGPPPYIPLRTAPRHLRDETPAIRFVEYDPLRPQLLIHVELLTTLQSLPDVIATLLTQHPFSAEVPACLLGTALLAVAASVLCHS